MLRPRGWPEAIWPLLGAAILLLAGLLPWRAALGAVIQGTDVYLFLTGMMLLSEIARRERLFDWLAAHAVRHARGSARRLFLLVYAVGTVVTVFLSNDATAVVLTPAVFAATRAAKADPLPYLFICAFIANAASFVLPISNPANLVLYGRHMPPLLPWLGTFLLPSILSVAVTLGVLLWLDRAALRQTIAADIPVPDLPAGGVVAALGIAATALALLAASVAGQQLGWPTALCGVVTAALVLARKREAPWAMLRDMSWSVLPLVAGLFMLVAALRETGVLAMLATSLHAAAARSEAGTAAAAGGLLGLVCNLVNNLPAGLIAGAATQAADLPPRVTGALLVGVDLGPNLSITGSLATILWLAALRREGESVGFWTFLARGVVAMPPALVAALGALLLG